MVAVADADPAGAGFFRHPHSDLIRLRTDHEAKTVVGIDGCGAGGRTKDFDLGCGIDEAFTEQIEIACQTRHAVGIDAAQVGGGEHVGSLRRVSLGHAEMQEDASAKFAQHFDGKYLGLYVGHAPPCILASRLNAAYAGRTCPRVSTPKGISSKPKAKASEVMATGMPSDP